MSLILLHTEQTSVIFDGIWMYQMAEESSTTNNIKDADTLLEQLHTLS